MPQRLAERSHRPPNLKLSYATAAQILARGAVGVTMLAMGEHVRDRLRLLQIPILRYKAFQEAVVSYLKEIEDELQATKRQKQMASSPSPPLGILGLELVPPDETRQAPARRAGSDVWGLVPRQLKPRPISRAGQKSPSRNSLPSEPFSEISLALVQSKRCLSVPWYQITFSLTVPQRLLQYTAPSHRKTSLSKEVMHAALSM